MVFVQTFLEVKKQMVYTLLGTRISVPIEIMAIQWVVEYMFKVQKVSHMDFLELHGNKKNYSKDK